LKVLNNQKADVKPENSHWYVYGILLFLIFGAALLLRIIPMQNAVFGSGWVNMQGVDGIYHLRLVENLLHHFPFRIAFDPYTFFPNGQDVFFAPLFDLLAGLCAWVIGLGNPSKQTIETVAAYFPAVLGALVTIPVYFIAKTIFNRHAGLISALILGVLPGTFLFRSRLGFFDHHVAEIFFSTMVILFLVLALNQIKQAPVSFANIKNKEWTILAKPLLFSSLCGISLGLYLLAWVGGLLFVFLVFCWALIAIIVDHLRKESTDYICILGIPIFLLALIVVIPFLNQIAYSELYYISLIIGSIGLILLTSVSRFLMKNNLRGGYFPLIVLVLGVIGVVGLFFVSHDLFNSMLDKFKVFAPQNMSLTIAEVQPLFFSQGAFTFSKIWNEFTTAVIIAPLAFIMLVVITLKNVSNQKLLLLLWSLIAFLASVGQIRFAAYLAVVFAILSAYFYSELINWIDWIASKLFSSTPKNTVTTDSKKVKSKNHSNGVLNNKAARKEIKSSRSSGIPIYKYFTLSLSVILIFFIGIFPDIKPAIATASTNAGTNSDWRSALLWMKENTPEPFSDPSYFNALYTTPEKGQNYNYPDSAYGVLAWWDYGHMITEFAHRIPNSNPTQSGADSAARYFLSQDESTGNLKADELGAKYIIIDNDVAIPYGISNNTLVGKKFLALPSWADSDSSKYAEVYYQQKDNKLSPIPIYYSEYYYSMVARLYAFHGESVIPANSTSVLSFETQSGRKIIKTSQVFPTYDDAVKFIKNQSSSNYRIVGTSPYVSPVPLEKLSHYEEVYKSDTDMTFNGAKTKSSYIEIFKYSP
jgi:dolichyl-phosphooligosaccharide-protein glycotransferase